MRAAVEDRRLEAIAGTPAAYVIGQDTQPVTPPDPYAPLALYAVTAFTGPTSNYQSFIRVNHDAGRVQYDVGGNGTPRVRVDFDGGASNTTVRPVSDAFLGVHVTCLQMVDGLTAMTLRDRAGVAGPVAVDPAVGWGGNASLNNGDATGVTVAASAMWWAEHTDWQQEAIMSWLAQRFSLSLSLSLSL